jgi:transposase
MLGRACRSVCRPWPTRSAAAAALAPLFKRLEAYRDRGVVPVQSLGAQHVRDDKPFGGPAPPGAVFHYSRDRAGEHPQAHHGKLYDPGRNAGPILEAAC